MKSLNLKITGMHCTGCSTRLEKVLNNLDGVQNAKVSFEEGKAEIEYEENKIGFDEIKEAIEDADIGVEQ